MWEGEFPSMLRCHACKLCPVLYHGYAVAYIPLPWPVPFCPPLSSIVLFMCAFCLVLMYCVLCASLPSTSYAQDSCHLLCLLCHFAASSFLHATIHEVRYCLIPPLLPSAIYFLPCTIHL